MATDVWSGKNGSFSGAELMSLYRNAENTALIHLLKRQSDDADQPLDFSRSKSSNRSNDLEVMSPFQGGYIKEGLASRLEDSQIVNSPDSQKAFVQELSSMSLKSSPSQSNNVRHKPYSKESPAIPNKTNHDNSALALALKTETPMESHVPLMMVANGQISPVLPATSPDVILNSSPVLGNPYVLFPPNCNGMIKLGTDEMKAPGKSIRPFKAFEHEILGQDSAYGSLRALSDPSLLARQSVLNGPAHYPRANSSNNIYNPADSSTLRSHLESSQQPKPSSRPQNGGVSTSSPDSEGIKDSECSSDSSMTMSHDRLNDHHHTDTSNGMSRRRKTERYPDNLKDEAYWERRRKNNEAAKRSRDTRRQKEDAIALRAKDLLDKNRQLGYYLTCQTQNMQHMQNQMRLLSEKHVESMQENKELKELLQKVAKFVEACPRCCTKDFQLLG